VGLVDCSHFGHDYDGRAGGIFLFEEGDERYTLVGAVVMMRRVKKKDIIG